MRKSLPLFIGLRYVRAKRRNHFISFISLFSIIGIALSVMVLIIVMSVMNGFESEIKTRLLSMESPLTLTEFSGDWQETAKLAKQHPGVIGATPYIKGFGLVSLGSKSKGVQIRGINPDTESEVSKIKKHMVYGKIEDLKKTKFGVILGYEIAEHLLDPYHLDLIVNGSKDPSRKVTLLVPQFQVGPMGVLPRYKRFTIVGVFRLHMQQYDSNMVMVNIRDAAKLYKKKGADTVQLTLKDSSKAVEIQEYFSDISSPFTVTTWFDTHRNIFSAIGTEKRMMGLILFILVLVAAINIVSTLVMVVADKEADIAIMRTMGASPKTIKNIFMVQGTVIGSFGTLMGVGLGVLVAYNMERIVKGIEWLFNFRFMDPGVYYISAIVGKVNWVEVGVIALTCFVVCILATLYPANSAAKTKPAEALRYE